MKNRFNQTPFILPKDSNDDTSEERGRRRTNDEEQGEEYVDEEALAITTNTRNPSISPRLREKRSRYQKRREEKKRAKSMLDITTNTRNPSISPRLREKRSSYQKRKEEKKRAKSMSALSRPHSKQASKRTTRHVKSHTIRRPPEEVEEDPIQEETVKQILDRQVSAISESSGTELNQNVGGVNSLLESDEEEGEYEGETPITGAFAVYHEEGEVLRRERGDDDVSVFSDEVTDNSDRQPIPAGDNNGMVLLEAQLAQPGADDEFVARLQEENTRLREESGQSHLPLAHAEVASDEKVGKRKRCYRILTVLGIFFFVIGLSIVIAVTMNNDNSKSRPTPIPQTPPPTPSPTIPFIPLPDGPWDPHGQVLRGKDPSGYFGESISLSRGGIVMAVGGSQMPSNDKPGSVSVFRWNDVNRREWIPMGQELMGEAKKDQFGITVSLNGDGTIIAVGAPRHSGGGDNTGRVRVYEYDSDSDIWVQLGSDLRGELSSIDGFGCSVSLSEAGDIVAVGARFEESINGHNTGSVRLFRYNRDTSSWNQLGRAIIGKAAKDQFGWAVSLSSSGTIVAVAAIFHDFGENHDSGQVSVYEYNSTLSQWNPLGDSIDGQVKGGRLGYSISLDDSGLVLAVGELGGLWSETEFQGRAFVYEHDRETSTWTQRGQTLVTEQPSDRFGNAVSLNSDGNVLAVASRWHNVTDDDLRSAGRVGIYQYDGDDTMEWSQVGEYLNGDATVSMFGWSVSLMGNGRMVAVGAKEQLGAKDALSDRDRPGSAYVYRVL